MYLLRVLHQLLFLLYQESLRKGNGYNMENRVGIIIRVTPEEKQAIEERMKTAGITNMNAYIQTMALYGSIYNLREIGEVTRLLRYAGNNINQLAVKAHTGKWISMGEIDEIKKSVLNIEQMVMSISDQLRRMNGET